MKLTPRMKNWLEAFGVHAVVATAAGFPTVIVAETVRVEEDEIFIPLSPRQKEQIAPSLAENTHVAIAPGQLGGVRAPYQFKGQGTLGEDKLTVRVEKIYCTKPGYEAGIRMDIMGFDEMKAYDESRWKDITPPGRS